MLIVQISDTHICAAGEKTCKVAPMDDNLRACIEHIHQMNPQPDLVLVTGDITDKGTIEEYQNALAILELFNIPVFVVPGNHDHHQRFKMTFTDKFYPDNNTETIDYIVDTQDLLLIALDTACTTESGGYISTAQCHWLDQQLLAHPNKPTLIFMHHPPVKCGVIETDIKVFIGGDILAEVVQRHSQIHKILCGHIHLSTHTLWYGTVVSTAPSTGMRLHLDLTLQQQEAFYLDDPAYQLHYWTADQQLITHTVFVHGQEKKYLFTC